MENLQINSPSRVIFAVSLTVATVIGLGFLMWKKRKSFEALTGEFKQVGKISKLIIYPVKSLPGIEIETAECTEFGLKFGPFRDRQFLIVKKSRNFVPVHQRIEPTLALTKLSIHDDQLWIDAPGMNTLKLIFKEKVTKTDNVIKCSVWGGDICGVDCGDEPSQWFNNYLKHDNLRLIQYVEDFKPRTFKRGITYLFPRTVGLLYHDDGCVHIFSEKSVEDLNSRLKDKVTHRNFRPSILVTGTTVPYEEDNWKFLKTGEVILMFTLPCGRCVMTTVNPDTGEKTEKEPLDTLKTYRQPVLESDKKKLGTSPMFGIYMASYRQGNIKRGDSISVVVSPRH